MLALKVDGTYVTAGSVHQNARPRAVQYCVYTNMSAVPAQVYFGPQPPPLLVAPPAVPGSTKLDEHPDRGPTAQRLDDE